MVDDLPPEIDPVVLNAALSVDMVRLRVVKLTMAAIDEAEDLIETGTPQVKMAVMRSVIPALIRGLTTQGQHGELEDMKAEMAELRRQVMAAGSIPVTARPAYGDAGVEPDLRAGRTLAPPLPSGVTER